MPSPLNGILVINKQRGISSAGVLTRMKHQFPKPERPKFGHAGTLDPFATGVLLVLVGQATKLSNHLMGQGKRYLATIKLGATTATLDPTSEEIPDPACDDGAIKALAPEIATQILPSFTGTILQAPPVFSALKHRGRRAYQFARVGTDIDLEPRPVAIYSIDVLAFNYPYLQIDVRCGKGTYIRSLARDIAAAMGTTGYLTQLIRTEVGQYTLEHSIDVESLNAANMASALRPIPPTNESQK